jgi:hypothetical protein
MWRQTSVSCNGLHPFFKRLAISAVRVVDFLNVQQRTHADIDNRENDISKDPLPNVDGWESDK